MLVHPLSSASTSRRSITKERRPKAWRHDDRKRRGDYKSWRCKRCGDYSFHPNRRCSSCGAFPCGSYTTDTVMAAAKAKVAAKATAAAKAAAVLGDILRRGGEAADAVPAALAPKIRAEPAASEATNERQVQRIIAWLAASPWELRKCKSLEGALAATAGALQHCSPAA